MLIAVLFLHSLLAAQTLSPPSLKDWQWRLVGPSAPAGRAWTVVGVESDPKTLYVTTAGGGLWKSTNNGTTFDPIFNHESSASTGAVAIARIDKNIVWVGTGEPACTRANAWGDGVYKSTDGGATWKNMGLEDSREISAIVIHPTNADTVYVAAMGYLWGTNQTRGVFKTVDGGQSWSRVLFVDDTTGVNDLQMDPNNPNILFAGTWHRIRWGDGDMTDIGKGSGVYRSTNAGATWERLSRGLPTDPMGKVHIAIARKNSRIVYANILTGDNIVNGKRMNGSGGLFRSEDGGTSWRRVNDRQTNYYYDRVYVDPSDDNTVWMPVFELNRSIDGGHTFERVNMKHVHNDLHSIWIDPNDPAHIALSGDGGVHISYDRCAHWQQAVLPIGQFYEVCVGNDEPYTIIGGMQDTGHWLGPSETYDEEGITARDWIKLRYNGDGMGCAIDPRDPNIVYMVQEFGNTSRLDLRSWDRVELQPTDTNEFKRRGLTHQVRWDWTPAFVLSIHNPDMLYLGSNYLFRINGKTGKWDVVSPDLSRQQTRSAIGSVDGFHSYGALFSVAESPADKHVLWAGADDGPIWVSTNDGKRWTEVDGNLPKDAPRSGVVAKIEASRFAKGTAYVVYDDHARENIRPYIYKTTDLGKSWSTRTGDLPEKGSTYVIREDATNPHVLYVGTEFAVFVTVNDGGNWLKLGGNFPTVGVRAMVIQQKAKELVVGTFGRALWVTDISPFGEISESVLSEPLHVFAMKTAAKFKLRETYGNTIEELNGDMFFRGANPQYGASLWYYLKDDAADSVQIRIKDSRGKHVRTLSGPRTSGFHRVEWNLKRDSLTRSDTLALKLADAMTPNERSYREQIGPGKYFVEFAAGSLRQTGVILVREEPAGGRHRVGWK